MIRTRWSLWAVALASGATLALTACDPAPKMSAGPPEWASADPAGRQLPMSKTGEDVSTDGRFLSLNFVADVAPSDRNGFDDIFVYDRSSDGLELVSTGVAGQPGNSYSWTSAISGNGRFVAFASHASNLVPGDTNATADVFLRDRSTSTTTRLTHAPDGTQAGSFLDTVQDISADGRWVLFTSTSDALVPSAPVLLDGVGLFLVDRSTGAISRVDRGNKGNPGNNQVGRARISNDGRFVAFESTATNLVWPADRNGAPDIYWRDRRTAKVRLVSVDRTGRPAGGREVDMSANGAQVSFSSDSNSVVTGDTNGESDVFVRDVVDASTRRVSVSSSGQQGNGISFDSDLSDDGRLVAFSSLSTNIVPGATDGSTNVFLHELSTGGTIAVTRSLGGGAPDNSTYHPRLSGNGSVVMLDSWATNLAEGASSGMPEVYAVPVTRGT